MGNLGFSRISFVLGKIRIISWNFIEFQISRTTLRASAFTQVNAHFADTVVALETRVGSAFLFVAAFDIFVLRISLDDKPVER